MRKNYSMLLLLFLLGCSGGPYGELEKEFKAKQELNGEVIESNTIVLTSQAHKSSYELRKVVDTSLSSGFVEINVNTFGYDKIQIPVSSISGCGKTCFGSGKWHADLLLGSQGIEISFANSNQVLEWCWSNDLPIISGKDKRGWLKNKVPLPDRDGYKQVSKFEYSEKIKQRCQGY